jgi:hypothetical protein
MSILVTDLRDIGLGLLSRVRSGVAVVRRTTPAVALLRLLVFVPLIAAWTLFVALSPLVLVVGLGLALAAALFPRQRAVGVALVTTAGTWLAMTTYFGVNVTLGQLLFLAAALYVAHSAAAFAAVLPHDTAVAPSALGRWALRTLSVVVVSLGLGVAGLFLAAWLPPQQSLAAPVLGSLLAIGLAALIAWLVRRRA